jgi:two-component system, OmpR family, phosphate regulon sensor histidine kinase PhoR
LRSIYWKITLPFIMLTLLGMAGFGLYAASTARNAQLSELRTYLINEARLIADVSLANFIAPDQSGLDILAKATGAQVAARITLIRLDGAVLGDSWENPAAMENHALRPEVVDSLATGVGVSTRYSTTTRENMMYAAVPVLSNGEAVGIARVALPLTAVEATVGSAARTIVFSMLAVAFLIMLLAAFITRRITSPLREITRASEALAGGNLSQRVSADTQDELGRLGQAFNEMSRRLAGTLAELKGEREQLSTILANIADGVLLVSSVGDIVLANQSAANLFGFAEAGSAGKTISQLVREIEVEQVVTSCLRSGREKNARFDSINQRYLRVIAVPLNYGKNNSGALLLCQDLTELRDLQTMRKDLIGNISHEFRTPLAGIQALVETLEEGALNNTSVARDFLAKIHNEVDRLTQMVTELTELSRIESGRTMLKKEALDLNRLINEVVAQLMPLATRQSLTLETHLMPDLPAVAADAERLRQVLVNLLHNAIKFTPLGGCVIVSSLIEPEKVVVCVADTGIGIAPADLPHVFERFYKADRARSGGGTGLGLAIVKHLVQAHGGDVWVKSTLGQGATFCFSLPLRNKI